jgi:hypothetical protein
MANTISSSLSAANNDSTASSNNRLSSSCSQNTSPTSSSSSSSVSQHFEPVSAPAGVYSAQYPAQEALQTTNAAQFAGSTPVHSDYTTLQRKFFIFYTLQNWMVSFYLEFTITITCFNGTY